MNKPFKTRWGLIGIGLVIVVLLFFLQKINVLKKGEDAITVALKPVQTLFFDAAERIKNFFVYFKDIKKLTEENESLKDSLAKLTSENLKLKNDITDSQLIKEGLAYVTQHNYQSVTAKIIGRISQGYSQVLLINKGESAGVKKGYPVVVNDGILVGKIIDTSSDVAKVLLLNDSQSQISAIVQNEARSPGVINGQYSLSLKMELIPQDQSLTKDQVVTTSGLEALIPSDIVIGTISEITKKEGELFQSATIKPATSYQNLRIVTIIIPSNG